MAQRRMFALSVVDTDLFLEMPASTQNLYFHLGMRADDDGFISNPKKITLLVNCSTDDLKLLIAKNFVIPFDSGVCVVRDWRVNNYIQKDRYRETRYLAEKRCLSVDETGTYNKLDTSCIQNVSSLDTQVRDRVSTEIELGEDKKTESKPPRAPRFSPPSLAEIEEYCRERGNTVDAQNFFDFYSAKNWMIGKNKMKDWRASVRTWERRGDGKKPDIRRPNNYYQETEGSL